MAFLKRKAMLRRVTNVNITRPSTGGPAELEDLVQAGMAGDTVHGSSING